MDEVKDPHTRVRGGNIRLNLFQPVIYCRTLNRVAIRAHVTRVRILVHTEDVARAYEVTLARLEMRQLRRFDARDPRGILQILVLTHKHQNLFRVIQLDCATSQPPAVGLKPF
jgi:hypothetical protein